MYIPPGTLVSGGWSFTDHSESDKFQLAQGEANIAFIEEIPSATALWLNGIANTLSAQSSSLHQASEKQSVP